MEFTYNGQTFEIQFRYYEFDDQTIKGKVTCCCIVAPGMLGLVRETYGIAQCHPDDQFCKETGRKIALRRALAKSFHVFDKDERKNLRRAAWQAYFARKKQPSNAKSKEEKE